MWLRVREKRKKREAVSGRGCLAGVPQNARVGWLLSWLLWFFFFLAGGRESERVSCPAAEGKKKFKPAG